MTKRDYINTYQAFVFELDNVLYPEKDYWLQVYYLFAQFIEYSEQKEGGEIVHFMGEIYHKEGNTGMFAKTAKRFDLPEKYQVNFDLLQQNARLPLKLLLFAPVLEFMQLIRASGKPIFLLVGGDPVMQLNKIRQMEWNGLEQYLKVYFTAEMEGGIIETLEKIRLECGLKSEDIVIVGQQKEENDLAFFNTFNFLITDKLYLS
jgi:hypothetical protein